MDKNVLVVLAAGMGSRYGGLKQIEPVDKNGNFIIDYSIFDALRAGFNKVVFVIREQNHEIFKSTVGTRVEKYVETDYAFQELDRYIDSVPDGRVKPWGTGHAVLCAKDKIDGNFAIINADDFYGREAFKTAYDFLQGNSDQKTSGLVAYKVGNTLTEFGSVKRGVCGTQDGVLTSMTESVIERDGFGQIVAQPIEGGPTAVLDFDHPVSMNLMCLNQSFLPYLEKYFTNFSQTMQDPLKDECYIQKAMFSQVVEEGGQVEVIPTNAVWHGVTYKEDKPALVSAIQDLIDAGEYPESLWANAQQPFTSPQEE